MGSVPFFTREEVARARAYHRPLYLAGAAGLVLDVTVLALLAWTPVGDALDPASLPWWARTPAYAAITVAVLTLVGAPLGLWTGLVRERMVDQRDDGLTQACEDSGRDRTISQTVEQNGRIGGESRKSPFRFPEIGLARRRKGTRQLDVLQRDAADRKQLQYTARIHIAAGRQAEVARNGGGSLDHGSPPSKLVRSTQPMPNPCIIPAPRTRPGPDPSRARSL